MHILLTRPLENSHDLILRFKSLGHKVSHVPLISIEKVNYEKLDFSFFKGIIFTSANAIKNLDIKIDFLINNAASGVMKNSIETTEKHWDWTMQINAKGPWILSKSISKLMPSKSRIINISSPGSTKVLNNYFSIGVSKAALESITRYMAFDLASKGINVNSISASMIETDAIKHFPNQEEIEKIISRENPKKQKLLAEDIAKAAVMLCSEESEMIIGQNILVDGGDTLLLS